MNIVEACELASTVSAHEWPIDVFESRWGDPPLSIFGDVKWLWTGTPLVDVLVASGLAPSKRRAREDIVAGSVYVCGRAVRNAGYEIAVADLRPAECFPGWWLVVGVGKRGRGRVRLFEVREREVRS